MIELLLDHLAQRAGGIYVCHTNPHTNTISSSWHTAIVKMLRKFFLGSVLLSTGPQLGSCVRTFRGHLFVALYAKEEALRQIPTPPFDCNTDQFQSGALALQCIGGKGEKEIGLKL